MARGVNKCIFIGNLTRDPEFKNAGGVDIANASIAVNDEWKDKDGNKKESVEFINIVFFRGLAGIAATYLKKGAKIYIEGKYKTDKYTDKATGEERYSTKIIVDGMQMLDGKGGDSAPQRSSERRGKPEEQGEKFDDFDDTEIPF